MLDGEEMVELVAAVASGDRQAFARLFEHFAPRMNDYFTRNGFPEESAEELAQDAMVALWHQAARYDPNRGTVSAWLFTIARNLRTDRRRQESGVTSTPRADVFELPEPVRSPDDQLHTAQLDRRVREALRELPPSQARVLQLFYFAERPHPEIARDLALPLGTVKSQIRRAIDQLRRRLHAPDR